MSSGITPLPPKQFDHQEARALKEPYIERDLIALDQGVNVLTDGLPDETISSRMARAATKGKWWGKLGSKILDLFQKDHGAKAEAGDTARGQRVVNTENEADGE